MKLNSQVIGRLQKRVSKALDEVHCIQKMVYFSLSHIHLCIFPMLASLKFSEFHLLRPGSLIIKSQTILLLHQLVI